MFYLIFIPIILFCITIHEYSHAKVADMLGDPTPRYAGRLTLNPLSHIDPFGLLMLIMVRIGWAKPVPINPYNFRDPEKGMMMVGLAGPASNFMLAWFLAAIVKTVPIPSYFWMQILHTTIWVNLALMVFNLMPI
ncbi:site-2 protease family protein, partial [Candidatus Margulisiibacteriota bacterium]